MDNNQTSIKNIQKQITTKLRYGISCSVYRNKQFLNATVYLDQYYPNLFIWISTDQQTYLIDLTFVKISFYSLQLELQLSNETNQKKKNNNVKRYILIKEFFFQIALIFNQLQIIQTSLQIDCQRFLEGKKPKMWKQFEKVVQNRKKQIQKYEQIISSSFSRFFKLIRIEIEKQSLNFIKIATGNPQFMLSNEIFKKILERILQKISLSIKKFQSHTIFKDQRKKFNSQQIISVVKIFYCQLNLSLLKSFYPNLQTSNYSPDYFVKAKIVPYSIIPSFKKDKIQKRQHTCFQALIRLENELENYIIPEYQINQEYPLTDYFCFSSHNTYLTGNQLTSDSKISRYIQDLKKGIKCVQLDVHNDGSGQPVITHAIKGKGLCKNISFRQTIEAIDQYLQSCQYHYPIILSIQNHANKQNKDLMNNIMSRQFNKNIAKPKLQGQFYKLSQVKGKIIIKTSAGKQDLHLFKSTKKQNQLKQKKLNPIENLQIDQIKKQTHNKYLKQMNYSSFVQRIQKLKQLKKTFNLKIEQNCFLPIDKIAQITCMFKAHKGISTPDVSGFQCSSMINYKIVKQQKINIQNYTKKAWLRSYPQGTQINSSNYNFLQLLARGVQIIALNTQTNDDYALMMNSYFRAGRYNSMQTLGYILKPNHLLSVKNDSLPQIQTKRQYKFTFYTHLNLEFKIYSLQGIITDLRSPNSLKSTLNTSKNSQVSISFKNIKSYNESFLMIYIMEKKFIQCIPLRFLEPTKIFGKDKFPNLKQFRAIIGRDYQFQDTGVRIICQYQCIQQ